MSDEVSLESALSSGSKAPKAVPGQVSLDKALGPDTRSGWKKDKSNAWKTLKDSLAPKQIKADFLDSWTYGLLQTGADAIETAVAKATGNKGVLEEQEKEFAERRKSARAKGEDPDKTMGEKLKEIPEDLKNIGKGLTTQPLTTGVMLFKSLMYDAPTFAVGGLVGVPAKVGRVAAALTKSEKAIAASKAAGAVAEGGAIGAAGESAHEHVTQGEATAGGALKGAAQMAVFDVGARALGLIRGARGKDGKVPEEEREFVNKPGGELTTPKKRTETPIEFVGRDEPTPYENIQARALFQNDAEYADYLNVHADQVAQKPATPLLEMAAKDSHTVVEDIQREVNGGKAEEVTDVQAKEVLDTPPESRTEAQRAALKKWQMRGMLGAAGGGLLAYSLADQDTQKAMLAMGVMAVTPLGKEHWEAIHKAKEEQIQTGYAAQHDEFVKQLKNTYGEDFLTKAAPGELNLLDELYEKAKKGEGGKVIAPADLPEVGSHIRVDQGPSNKAAYARAAISHPQINTREFKDWFKDSLIKNAQGVPFIMYHGTAQDISEFKGKQAGAIFLSPNPSFSKTFAEMSKHWMQNNPDKVFNKNELKALEHGAIRERARRLRISEEQAKQSIGPDVRKSPEFRALAERHTRSGPNIMPVFVRAEKPWDYESFEDTDAVARKVGELAPPGVEWEESDEADLASKLMSGDWETIESKEVQKAIKALGYDSFYMQESGVKNLAVYDSRQIKSATGNSGKFAEVPNITGSAQTEFLALLAGAGLGALVGSQMDKDESPVRTALTAIFGGVLLRGVAKKAGELPAGSAGRVARGAAESMAPGKIKDAATRIASKIPGGEKAPEGRERVRIKDAIVDHQTRMARTAREVMQLTRMAFEKVPSLERRQEISRALDGEMVALSKSEREVFEALKASFRKIGDDAVAAGVLDELRENYITHLVKRGQEEKVKKFLAQIKGGPSMDPRSPYAKERTFKGFMSEMGKAGIELESKDAATIYGKYAFAMQRSIANANLLSALKNDARGIFVPAGPKAPAGFVTIDRPLLLGQKVHPDIVPELTALFDTRDPDAWIKVASALNTAAKRTAVSFSLFHAMSLTQAFAASQGKIKVAMATGAAGAALGAAAGNDPYITGLAGVAAGMFGPAANKARLFATGKDSLIKQIREGGHGDVVDDALRHGLSISMERQRPVVTDVAQDFYTGMESLQGFLDKFVHPVAGKAVEKIAKVNHGVDNIMWGRLHAGMKIEVYMDKKAKLLRENAKAREKSPEIPLMSEDRAGEIAATYANTLFGGLNWTRMMEDFNNKFARRVASALTSPTGLRYLNIAMFAPDWTISTTMSALRAADIRPSQRELSSLHRQYMVRAALYTAAAAEAINYASTGKHLWEEEDWTVVHLGDGSTMQLSKHFFEPFEWAKKGTQELLNKMGGVPAEALEQITGDEYLSTSGAPKMGSKMSKDEQARTGRKTHPGHLEHLAKRFLPMGVAQALDNNVLGGVSGTLGVPIYPPKKEKKKKKSDEYLEDSMQ